MPGCSNDFNRAAPMIRVDSAIVELHQSIKAAISSVVSEKRIGVAFSGGVDSSLVAKICHDMEYDIVLLTVGFSDSHDISFSKQVNEFYGYRHEILEITDESFQDIFPKIKQQIRTDNMSWNENSIAFYYISRLAKGLGITTVVTANGIDELFCGYDMYRTVFDSGEQKILELMDEKIENEVKMMRAVNSVTSEFGVSILNPLLCLRFIEFAKTVPLAQKITGKCDIMRKHAIRSLAAQCGVPPLACHKRKKALQYGTRIHKSLLRSM